MGGIKSIIGDMVSRKLSGLKRKGCEMLENKVN